SPRPPPNGTEAGTVSGGNRRPRSGRAVRAALAAGAERRLGGGETGDRDAEGAAAHVIEPDLLEEGDARRVAAVLAADAELQAVAHLAPAPRGHLDERADAFHVERDEGVSRQDAALDVCREELARVVAREPHRGLGEIVRAERE